MRLFVETLQVAVRAFLLTAFVVGGIALGQAQVMSSGSFQVESDSINFGGGRSTSSSYVQESTFGEIGSGNSSSTNYSLRAGYQQMLESYISLSVVADVVLSPSLGLAGGTSNGSTSLTIITDNRAGYSASVSASNAPAMQSGVGSIANYLASSTVPDYAFFTNISDAHFGFSPEGVDISSRWRDNGTDCGVGGLDTPDACWDMVSTTPVEVLRRAAANHPNGSTSTLKFRVGIGATAAVTAGSYTATSTVTALTL
jgi:hypothetical protein